MSFEIKQHLSPRVVFVKNSIELCLFRIYNFTMLDFRRRFGLYDILTQLIQLSNLNLPVQLKFWDFTFPSVVLTPFYTEDETSWLRNTVNCTLDRLLHLTYVTRG